MSQKWLKTSNDQSTQLTATHCVCQITQAIIRCIQPWNLWANAAHVITLCVAFAYKFQICIYLLDGSSDLIGNTQCVSDKTYLCWLVFWCFSQTLTTAFLSLFPNFVERYVVSSIIIILASWNETVLQSCTHFVVPKYICILLKINFHAFHVYKVFLYFCNRYFKSSWNHIHTCFAVISSSNICGCFIGPS